MESRAIPAWVFSALLVLGAGAVTVTSTFATRVFLMFGVHYALVLQILVGVATLVAMYLRRPQILVRCLRRLAPVGAFALVSLCVVVIASTKLPSYVFSLARVSLGPAAWFSAAVLGYLAGRSKTAPLAVAAVSCGLSVAGAALSVLERVGMSNWLTRMNAGWVASIGGVWTAGPSETFRSVGFDIDPNTFGLIGCVGLIAALCIAETSWLRVTVAVTSGAVVALSGSRTAVFTAVAATVVSFLAAGPRSSDGLRVRSRAIAPAAAGLLLGIVLASGAMLLAGSGGAAERLVGSASHVANGAESFDLDALDEATGRRIGIWSKALDEYAEHPLGAFVPPEWLIERSVHNEYLERLLYGGPVLLAALLGLLMWLSVRVRPAGAPALGPTLAVTYGVAALGLGPSALPPFLGMFFYFVGWGRAQPMESSSETDRIAARVENPPADGDAGVIEKA